MVRLRIEDAGALRGAAQKLPLVGDTYFIMFAGEVARKRIKRGGKLQYSHRSLVDFRMPAAAPNDGFQEFAVGSDGDLDHRSAGELLAPCGVGKVHRAHTLDLAPPAVQVHRNFG